MDFTYSIRPATPEDVGVVLAMIKELAAYQNMLDQCKLTADQLREDGFGANPFFQCLIAEAKSSTSEEVNAVGYALFYYIYSTFKGRNVYLEDVYVKEPFRKKGIGGELMQMVAKIAIEKGCTQYRFACLGWNTNALDFYKSVGARDLTEIEDWHVVSLGRGEMHELAAKLKRSG